MRISFQEELDALENSLRAEGELVLRSLRGAVEAVCSQDLELADEVMYGAEVPKQVMRCSPAIRHIVPRSGWPGLPS